MRSNIGLLLVGLGLAAGTSACTITDASTNSTTGTTGTTGGHTGGAGQGGAGADPCNGVSVFGECSADKKTIQSCFVSEESGIAPQVLTNTCDPGTECQMWKGTAACRPTGACFEGQTQCKDQGTLQVCKDGAWADSSCNGSICVQTPGKGATCTQQDAGGDITIHGHLDYEVKKPNQALTDFETTGFEGAVDMFITVFEDGELIGMGLTSPGDANMKPGDFSLKVIKQPTAKSYIYFWPMLFDQSGNPRLALAKAMNDDAMTQSSEEYWSYGFETCNPANCGGNDIDLGALQVDEANNAGGIHIYQWLDYGMFRMEQLIPGQQTYTMGVFWQPGIKFNCGSCFVPPQGGGAQITYDKAQGLVDHYDTSLNIAGSDASPHHWSRTTINHELGHWVMQTYSKSPGEGGPHYIGEPSKPGLAYSEGFATFFAQTNISADNANNQPIAFRKSNGTTFWVDYSKLTMDDGKEIGLPDPNGPIDQDINEDVVGAMMWSFWAADNARKPQNLNDAAIFNTLHSPRLLGDVNRGYQTVDFVDFLDAMSCGQQATGDQILDVVTDSHYPYDHQPQCQ